MEPSSFFNGVAGTLVGGVSAAVSHGLTVGFNQGIVGPMQQAAKALATSAGEMISTGRAVVDSAVEAADQAAGQVLRGAVTKIAQWQSFLTQNVLGGLSRVLGTFTRRIHTLFTGTLSAAGGVLSRIGHGAGGVAGGIGHLGAGLLRSGAGMVAGLGRTVLNGVVSLGQEMFSALSSVATAARNVITAGWNAIQGAFSSIFGTLLQNIRNSLSAVWQSLQSALSGLYTMLRNAITGALQTAWSAITQVLSGVIQAVTGALQSALQAVLAFAKSPWGLVAAGIALLAAGAWIYTQVQKLGTIIGSVITNTASLVSTAFSTAWSVLGSVGTWLRGIIVKGWQIVADVLTKLFGFLGRVFDATVGLVRNAWNAIAGSGIGGGLISGIKAVLSNTLSLAIGSLKIGVAAGAMAVFGKAVYEAAKAAMEFAKSAQQLRAFSGLSFGASANLLGRGRALGISDQSMIGAFGGGPAAITNMKARMFGLPDIDSAEFLPSAANLFQSLRSKGMGGQSMAQAIVKAMGMDSPEFINALMLPAQKIREQLAWQANLNARLGLTPDVLKKFATDIPLLFGKIGAAWEAAKMKLAVTAAPIIERVLNMAINLFAANAGKIAGLIETVTEWMFVKAPVMLADGLVTVTSLIADSVTSLLDFGQNVATNLPTWLGNATQNIANIMVRMAAYIQRTAPIIIDAISGMFESVGSTISGWMRSLADFLADATRNKNNPLRSLADSIRNFLQAVKTMAENLFTSLSNNWLLQHVAGDTARAFGDIAKSLGNTVIPNVDTWFQNNPDLLNASDTLNKRADWVDQKKAEAIKNVNSSGKSWTSQAVGKLLEGALWIGPKGEQWGRAGQKRVQSAVNSGRENVERPANIAAAAAKEYQRGVGSEESRKIQYEQLKAQQQIAKNTDETNQSIDKQIAAMSAMQERMISRILAYSGQDTAFALLRVS